MGKIGYRGLNGKKYKTGLALNVLKLDKGEEERELSSNSINDSRWLFKNESIDFFNSCALGSFTVSYPQGGL